MGTTLFNYNNTAITFSDQQGQNVMVNATQMAKAFGKRPAKWLELPSTKEFLKELRLSDIRKSDITLVLTQKGNSSDFQQGTWMHEDVALEFARWLSPKFAIWCNDRIKELIRFGITATPDTAEMIINNPEKAAQLLTQLKQQRQLYADTMDELLHTHDVAMRAYERIKSDSLLIEQYQHIINSYDVSNTTSIAVEYNMTAEDFNLMLQSYDIQRKRKGRWILTRSYRNHGYTEPRTLVTKGGETIIYNGWTHRGRLFLYSFLRTKGIIPQSEKKHIEQYKSKEK